MINTNNGNARDNHESSHRPAHQRLPHAHSSWLLVVFHASLSRHPRKKTDYIARMQTYLTEHLAETRRLNDTLDRIANALEKKHQ
jgi:hypothetical protein